MEKLFIETDVPVIEFSTHGEAMTYFEPVAAYCSSIVCCCCSS
ncbi:hypothetical protein [Crossiella sp. SN42]|nr:hypothetical protein [Crossiella sp. SN42]